MQTFYNLTFSKDLKQIDLGYYQDVVSGSITRFKYLADEDSKQLIQLTDRKLFELPPPRLLDFKC